MADQKPQRPRIGPVPIAGVMLVARAIIEQGRVEEFIAECEDQDFHMRAKKDLMDFAQEFIRRPLVKEAAPKPGTMGMAATAAQPKLSANALKFTNSATECDNTFKKKKSPNKT